MFQNFYAFPPLYKELDVAAAGTVSQACKRIIGIRNVSSATQTLTGAIYDNPGGTTGRKIINLGALTAGQVVTFPPPGIPVNSGGITFVATGTAPADPLVIEYA